MISGKVDVQVTEVDKGDLKRILEALKKLSEDELLVGISADTAGDGRGEDINNAELAYIHTNGVRSAGMKAETDKAVEEGTPYPLALQAYIKEHGSPAYRVPPRPFLEPGIEKHLDMVKGGMKAALLDVLNGGDGRTQRENLGGAIAGKVQEYFEEDNGWPPLSPKTIARRKKGSDGTPSDLPLVDTGALRQSITYIIRPKDKEE